MIYNPVSKHYYELVLTPGGALEADAGAAAKGGHLLVINDVAEAAFIQEAYAYEPTAVSTYNPSGPPTRVTNYDAPKRVYGGLPVDELAGDLGAWIGLSGVNVTTWNWSATTTRSRPESHTCRTNCFSPGEGG